MADLPNAEAQGRAAFGASPGAQGWTDNFVLLPLVTLCFLFFFGKSKELLKG